MNNRHVGNWPYWLLTMICALFSGGCVFYGSEARSLANAYYSQMHGVVYKTLKPLAVERDAETARKQCEDAVYAYGWSFNEKGEVISLEFPESLKAGTRIVIDDVHANCKSLMILPFPSVPIPYRRYCSVSFHVEGNERITYSYYCPWSFWASAHWPVEFHKLPFHRVSSTNMMPAESFRQAAH